MSTTATEVKVEREFGAGRYSHLMEECYHDAQRVFGIAEDVAFRLAQAICRDYGAAMASGNITGKIGKISSEQRCTLSEAAKVKNVFATNSLRLMRAMQWANECKANGIDRSTKMLLVEE